MQIGVRTSALLSGETRRYQRHSGPYLRQPNLFRYLDQKVLTENNENSKHQAANNKYQTNFNDQNPKFKTDSMVAENLLNGRHVSVIGILNLEII